MAIQDFEKDFHRITIATVADGQGGNTKTFTESTAATKIALYCDQSLEARIAEKQGVKSVYTINFDSSIALSYDDYVKRVSDGAIFRITSDPVDYESPSVTTLNRRTATAERTELPTP